MSKQREVRVGVKTPEAALAEAAQVWKRAEKGHAHASRSRASILPTS